MKHKNKKNIYPVRESPVTDYGCSFSFMKTKENIQHAFSNGGYLPNSFSKGFSLIEMLVVVSMFALISAVILGNYPSFSHKISIQNLAHQIALEIRQAQVFGLSVKETAAGTSAFPGYGVYFSAGDPFSFILFTDFTNNDKKYNFAGQDCSSPSNFECIEKVSISSGDNIKDICGIISESPEVKKCSSNGELDYANISFVRPDPDATITGTLATTDTNYQSIEISIEPPKKDFCKIIKVWVTGQISISPQCP